MDDHLDEEEEKVLIALSYLIKRHKNIDGRKEFTEEEIFKEILKLFPPTRDDYQM